MNATVCRAAIRRNARYLQDDYADLALVEPVEAGAAPKPTWLLFTGSSPTPETLDALRAIEQSVVPLGEHLHVYYRLPAPAASDRSAPLRFATPPGAPWVKVRSICPAIKSWIIGAPPR